jgi:nitrogen regulatory protein P-II 1
VKGFGRQKATPSSTAAPNTFVDFLPKVKVEVVVADSLVEKAMDAIVKAAHTARSGTGRSS